MCAVAIVQCGFSREVAVENRLSRFKILVLCRSAAARKSALPNEHSNKGATEEESGEREREREEEGERRLQRERKRTIRGETKKVLFEAGSRRQKTGREVFEMNRILYVDVSLQHEIRKWSGRKPVVSISPYTHHRGRPTASAVAMRCSSPRPAHGAHGANGQCPRPPPSGTRSCRARSRGRDEPTGGACTRGASRRPGCSRCRPH